MRKKGIARQWMKHRYCAFLLLLAPALSHAGAVLVPVPGGSFEPFWTEEKDKTKGKSGIRLASVPPLKAEAHAVTNQDFLAFLEKRPEWRKSRISPLFADESYLSQFESDLKLKPGVNARAPVTFVSWYSAKAYCDSLGRRLPTTDEWEYMAAASEAKADASKDPAFLGRILEWYSHPQSGALPAVKSTYRNVYGLYDMHGLIWEWVEDFNSNLVTGESREDGAVDRNLFCGAGNLSGGNKENYAAFMRFAFRSSMKGKGSVWNLGFRCVR
jgi:formylglycine-generating enzyme required for sulfatase activity